MNKKLILVVLACASGSLLAMDSKVNELVGAAKDNDFMTVQRLIEQGVDVNAFDDGQRQALANAAYYGHLGIVTLLLKHGAKVTATSLINAASGTTNQGSRLEIVKILLDKGANINAQSRGTTALMAAVTSNNKEVVRLLLDRGADRTKKNEDGKTALMLAKEHAKTYGDAIVKMLSNTGKKGK